MVNRIKGFSLFELVVVLTIIGVLIAIAIDKLPAWQEQAERAAMQNVVGSLNSALGIKLASYLLGNDLAGVRALQGSNPMDQLVRARQLRRGPERCRDSRYRGRTVVFRCFCPRVGVPGARRGIFQNPARRPGRSTVCGATGIWRPQEYRRSAVGGGEVVCLAQRSHEQGLIGLQYRVSCVV